MQLGLFVFDLKVAHFVQWNPDVFDITVVHRDEAWLDRNMPLFRTFWDDVEFYKQIGFCLLYTSPSPRD